MIGIEAGMGAAMGMRMELQTTAATLQVSEPCAYACDAGEHAQQGKHVGQRWEVHWPQTHGDEERQGLGGFCEAA